jgi:hypothetical protein
MEQSFAILSKIEHSVNHAHHQRLDFHFGVVGVGGGFFDTKALTKEEKDGLKAFKYSTGTR